MKWHKWFLWTLVGFASNALAQNRIVEWGGHSQSDYTIAFNRYVLIRGNSQPALPWKFEAYDEATGAPGVIQDIHIQPLDPNATVGSIRLSVIGQAPYLFGAADVWSLDLDGHGDPDNPNIIDEIVIKGDFGEYGPMKARGGGTLTIAEAIDRQETQELRAYWRAVYEALTE